MEKLSRQHPDLEFDLEWADEDIGSNQGHLIFKDGESTDEYPFHDIERDHPDRIKFYFSLKKDRDPKEWGYDENYKYVGDEEEEEEPVEAN